MAASRSTLLPSSAPFLILWPQPYKNCHLGFNHHHHPQTGKTMVTPATRWCHIWQWPNWLKSTIAREKNWPLLQIWRSTLRTLPCLGADVTVEWRMVVFTIEHTSTVCHSSISWPVASKKWRSGVEFAQVFVWLLLLRPHKAKTRLEISEVSHVKVFVVQLIEGPFISLLACVWFLATLVTLDKTQITQGLVSWFALHLTNAQLSY